MKKWEIIREAKKHLAKNHTEEFVGDGTKHEYICWAVASVETAPYKQKRAIRNDIEKWLEGETTYGRWLLSRKIVSDKEYFDDDVNDYPKRQAGRLAWMNWMQAYYKERNE